MENIKDNEKYIFWSVLYFNKMYDYSMTYTTMDAAEFQKYIGTYDDSQPGMPFFFQIEDGTVKVILEKQIA